MLLKIAICDDEPDECHKLQAYLKQYEFEYDIDFTIDVFTDTAKLLEAYTHPARFHLLFLDVEMPVLSGLDAAKRIRSLPDFDVKIIFITNYPKYMHQSFDVQAFQYLVKPVSYTLFCRQMQNILHFFLQNERSVVLVNGETQEEFINLSQLLCIEVCQSRLTHQRALLFTMTDREITVKGAFSEWEKRLADYHFTVSSRGTLVNLTHIRCFHDTSLELSNGKNIPLSRRRALQLHTLFAKQIVTLQQW